MREKWSLCEICTTVKDKTHKTQMLPILPKGDKNQIQDCKSGRFNSPPFHVI
jgi:hypothetical protein